MTARPPISGEGHEAVPGEETSGRAASLIAPEGSFGRRWLSAGALRLHLTLLLVVPGCMAAGWFELTRARDGNELSWVYVFEWPFFAGFAIYLWWRLLHEGDSGSSRDTPASEHGARAGATNAGNSDRPGEPAADPQLAAWNEYLARLHAKDLGIAKEP
jgi:hypothetical protein